MTDNVIYAPIVTRLDLQPERVLQQAADAGLDQVVVLGYDKDGGEYFASSVSDGGAIVWLMERLKLQLLRTVDDDPPA